jgi:preprotein translocase subunit SecA
LCKKILEQRASDETADPPFREAESYVLLRTTDRLWMDHIDALDDLRKGVGLQSIGQHDPLIVYKKEAYDMFEKLNDEIKVQTIRMLFFGKIVRVVVSQQEANEDINPERKLNGPCPCGSGKKYKNCCYQKDLQKNNQQQPTVDENRPLTKQEEYALKRQQRKENKIKNKK